MPDTPTLPRRSADEQARLEAMLRDMFEKRIHFNELLGLRVASLAPASPQLSFAMRRELVGSYVHGRLHGGMISATLDTVGGLAVTVGVAEKHAEETAEQVAHRFGRIGTIDLRVDYLRPAIGEQFELHAEVLRLGSRVANTRMEFTGEGGRLLASGAGAYIIS